MSRYFAADPETVRLSVSAVVLRRPAPGEDEILLMRRSDNGCWGIPGGYVEPGESVAAAAARETREETGFLVEVGRLVGVYSDPCRQVIEYPDGARVQSVNLCFLARPLSAGTPTTPEETLEVGFFPVRALPDPMVPIHGIRIRDALAGGEAAVR